MSWLPAKDISVYQGSFQDTGEPIVMIKISGGDAGLYFDPNANANYNAAKSLGKAVGGYHFAGGGDPIAEADFFVKGMSPVAEDDVFALDWEVQHANPVGWCLSFVNEVHNKVGVWPLLYINSSTLNAYDWSPVLANCGLWLANWAVSPDDTIPTPHVYVMQQYTDTPYDKDAWFGTIEQFKAYGYHAAPVTPPVEPTPPPANPSDPVPPAATSITAERTTVSVKQIPLPVIPPKSKPTVVSLKPKTNWFIQLLIDLWRGI